MRAVHVRNRVSLCACAICRACVAWQHNKHVSGESSGCSKGSEVGVPALPEASPSAVQRLSRHLLLVCCTILYRAIISMSSSPCSCEGHQSEDWRAIHEKICGVLSVLHGPQPHTGTGEERSHHQHQQTLRKVFFHTLILHHNLHSTFPFSYSLF